MLITPKGCCGRYNTIVTNLDVTADKPMERELCLYKANGSCGICMKNCPTQAIKVVDNLAVIDYEKCVNCHLCAMNCPVGCIKISDFSGIHRYVKEEA